MDFVLIDRSFNGIKELRKVVGRYAAHRVHFL